MSEKDDDKVEVRVVVESKDSASKVILIALTLALVGVLIAVISGGSVEDLLLKRGDSGEGNWGDGSDNQCVIQI